MLLFCIYGRSLAKLSSITHRILQISSSSAAFCHLPSLIKVGNYSLCDSLMARVVLLAGFFLGFVFFSEAYDFYVGVRSGWVLKPAESYNSWAERMRFQVKDKLIFNYKKGEDSVLVVNKEDYESCNTKNPIKKFDDGKSVFIFDRSGPFFFISGADGHCAQGQKLIVVVMAVRNKPVHPPPSSPPPSSPTIPPPSASTPSPSPVPGTKPPSSSPSPAPAIKPPTSSPSPSPAAKPPTSSLSPSPAPAIKPPSSSPSPAPATKSPSPAPATKSPSSSPSPSPSSSSSPATSPASSPAPSQAKSPSPSSTPPVAPGTSPAASELSPPPPSSSPGGSSGAALPALSPSSNSTSTPTPSSAQVLSASRLFYGIFTLFLGAVVLL